MTTPTRIEPARLPAGGVSDTAAALRAFTPTVVDLDCRFTMDGALVAELVIAPR